MEVEFIPHHHKGKKLAEYPGNAPLIQKSEDVMDVIGNLYYQHFEALIISAGQLPESFFELKSGVAGEFLQKFSNFRLQLFIIGHFSEVESKSLRDFIRESNRGDLVNFLESTEEIFSRS